MWTAKKIHSRSHSRGRILGICHQFKIDDPGSDEGEAEIPDLTMQEPIGISMYDSLPSGSGNWHYDFPEPSSFLAPLHYRGLQELRNKSLALHHSYNSQILLSQRVMTDLKWWIDHGSQWRLWQILTSQPALTIESDASDLGWEQLVCPPRMWQEEFGVVRSGFFTSVASSSWQHGWVYNVMPRTWGIVTFIWR